jgi:hypothetical protein
MSARLLRWLAPGVALFAALVPVAQTAAQKAWTPPKTPWGDPDLQGVWPGTGGRTTCATTVRHLLIWAAG